MSKTCTIIPVFNEANRLPRAEFLNYAQRNPEHLFLFVNDSSTDASRSMIDELQDEFHEGIQTLHLQQNGGKAEAIRQGMLLMKGNTQIAVIGYLDADLATPLAAIEKLITPFSQNTEQACSFGSRVQLLGLQVSRHPARHYAGRLFATVVSLLFQLKIYDTQCGAKYFNINTVNQGLFDQGFVSRWFFDIEIFIRLKKMLGAEQFRQNCRENALESWQEVGDSRLKFKDFVGSPLELLKIYRRYQ